MTARRLHHLPARSLTTVAACAAFAALTLLWTAACAKGSDTPRATKHDDLVALFNDWRAFQRPKLVDGVPDYSARAMAAQRGELPAWQARLRAVDTTGWTTADQVDWHLVRAEMNGLDFDHRVLQPWARNPAFYVTVFPDQSDQPAREGPFALGAIELWQYRWPLDAAQATDLIGKLRHVPPLLTQARTNLTGTAKDLWTYGALDLRAQSADLAALHKRMVAGSGIGSGAGSAVAADLTSAIDAARVATDSLVAWLDAQAASKTTASGIGVANYDWYLKNVQLVPWTWHDEVTLMERELVRAHAFLRLEEARNAKLPPAIPVASAEEHARRFNGAVTEYMNFLRTRDLMPVADYLEPALRARVGRFNPATPRAFFTEVDYRDPMVMRTHGFHWFDLARMTEAPHASPIRRGPLLYNIFITRTEGHATGWEEMMLQAGMFDARPRSRELIYILLAQRAARALGDLKMHANELTLDEAAAFAAANTPKGWLRLDTPLVRFEQHLYLQQPSYGTSYLIGKIQIEAILAARRRQLGDAFTMHSFMDEFMQAGLVPASLIHWQLAGLTPNIARMLAP
jgi:uncharacterized protein (DUF885 family)